MPTKLRRLPYTLSPEDELLLAKVRASFEAQKGQALSQAEVLRLCVQDVAKRRGVKLVVSE